MVLAVWSVPQSPSFLYADIPKGYYHAIYHPVYWLQPIYLPSIIQLNDPYMVPRHLHFRNQHVNNPSKHDISLPFDPHIQSSGSGNHGESLEQLTSVKDSFRTRLNPSERVIVSSLSPPRSGISMEGFGDKSLLGLYFNRFAPMRFASRLTTLSNVRISYRNITLAGIAIG